MAKTIEMKNKDIFLLVIDEHFPKLIRTRKPDHFLERYCLPEKQSNLYQHHHHSLG